MTGQIPFLRHQFAGGWNTDAGPVSDVAPDRDGVVNVPFLIEAENCLYEADGGPHKIPGTIKLNSVQMESGAVVKGLFDFWGVIGGAFAQHRIVHVGTTIKRDDGDGTFTDLFTGLAEGAVPSYAVLEGLLVMANDNAGDVPRSWNGSVAQNLAGSPPNFSIVIQHKGRLWAAGVASNPSRLSYSALLNGADWTGSGSGSIDIDPGDGDEITGLISHRNELWVFKGPHKGSIHRIAGSAPTGSDAFSRHPFANGVGAVGHNTIRTFANDVAFLWSDGSVRALSATERFGDFSQAALSLPIQADFMNRRVRKNRLRHAWMAVDDVRSLIVISLAVDGSLNNTALITMDFRFAPGRWSFIPAIAAGCVASIVDQTDDNRRVLMFGGNDGYVRRWEKVTRDNDGSAIAYKWTWPYLTYGRPEIMKTLYYAFTGVRPKYDTKNNDFRWQRDDNPQQSLTTTGTGITVLGSFTLSTDVLSGEEFQPQILDLTEGGEFRAIQYQMRNNSANEDFEVHSLYIAVQFGALSLEE